jgi:predicted DNA-binding protein
MWSVRLAVDLLERLRKEADARGQTATAVLTHALEVELGLIEEVQNEDPMKLPISKIRMGQLDEVSKREHVSKEDLVRTVLEPQIEKWFTAQ